MQPLKASGKVENGITETVAPCSSTNAYKCSSLTFKKAKRLEKKVYSDDKKNR